MTAAHGDEQTRRYAAHVTSTAAAASSHGQVRALAHLLGIRPALSTGTCSRLAATAATKPTHSARVTYLRVAGLTAADARAVAILLWRAP